MKGRILIIALILTCLYSRACFAQYTNDAGVREKHFIYEVKQIDEFFERFNDDKDSFIRKVYASYKKKYTIRREDLVKTLFNYETNSWNTVMIDSFITSVTAKNNPVLLNFYGNDWYAEALCRFQYQSAEIDIPVILKLDADENKRSKWIIEGIKQQPFSSNHLSLELSCKDNRKFIHPASHSNNFIALTRALEDKENLPAYFDKRFFTRNNTAGFYHAILHSQLKLLYIKSITYHFLQVSGWVFTVESFPRKVLNSGWLISSLKKISENDKEKYRAALLDGE